MSDHFASGNWHVKEGKEAEFIERWNEFLQWTRKTQPALVSASLIRDVADSKHFVSFAEWQDTAGRDTWRNDPEWSPHMMACRELCEDFYGNDFERVALI